MELNRLKVFYVTLCLFFAIGTFVTAYENGKQMESMPDMSWQTPEYFVGYFNNYLNQKVNPMTLGDVFVTEYIEHPDEPTGVIPLYPTQTVIQERTMVNCSITEIETFLVPDDNNTYGTIVGIGLYIKRGELGKWRLEKYDTISTSGNGSQTKKVVIETPRITFDEEGGSIRLVMTNFGTEVKEVVYIPTIVEASERSSFSGMNTIVDTEDALYLTIKNKYQMVKGYQYYIDYKNIVGLQLHEVAYKQDENKDISISSNEIIAIFDYPSLKRKDSVTNRYSSFRSLFSDFLDFVDPKLVTNLEEILVQIPIIGTFFKFKPYETDLSYTTTFLKSDINIQEYVDRLVESSQNNLEHATQPAIQTMLLTRNAEATYELIEYFNRTFVSDYNEFEKQNKFTLTRLDWKIFKLELTGQKQKSWILDLTKSMDSMITERNPIPGRDDLEHRSFRWLLNKLNSDYYSSVERGSTGIQTIKQRVETRFNVDRNIVENFNHLVKQVENIAVPEYNKLRIVTDPALGTFNLLDEKGVIVQKYDMINMQELAGKSVNLLTSQSEKIFLWLQKTFGPWSNLQVPDEQPAYEWRDFTYSMDDDRDGDELFLGGSNSNINSLAYNGIERPLDFSLQSEDTPRGWYRGDATYDYLSGIAYTDVSDNDWDTPGMGLNVGLNSTIDIELSGGWTDYYNYSASQYDRSGHYLDNNGWMMFDLGDDIPEQRQWRVSFDFWKTESDPSDRLAYDYFGNGMGESCPQCGQADYVDYDQDGFNDYYEAGVGIALTNDVGIKQLMERHDVDLYIPLQLDHVSGWLDIPSLRHGLPPDGVISLSAYDPFYIMNTTHGFSSAILPHFPGGTLWGNGGQPMYHQMTYGNTLKSDFPIGTLPWDYNAGGVLYLEPESWNQVDIYYDGVTGLLNIFVNDVLVRSNLYIPAINSEDEPTLENIWFYNYGYQTTYISNLEISEKVSPMVTPLKSSVVNIERLASEQGMTAPIIINGPYQYGYTSDNSQSFWPETNLISD